MIRILLKRIIQLFCFCIIIFNSVTVYSEGKSFGLKKDTIAISEPCLYKHSYSIVVNNLFVKNVLFNYATLLKYNTYYDFSLGLHYRGPVYVGSAFGFNTLIEQTNLNYNSVMFRSGLKQYAFNRFFAEIMLNYRYDFNNHMKIVTNNNSSYKLCSRHQSNIGVMAMCGIMIDKRENFISELYVGIGIRKTNVYETVRCVDDFDLGYTDYSNNPIHNHENEIIPTLHFGITVGFTK